MAYFITFIVFIVLKGFGRCDILKYQRFNGQCGNDVIMEHYITNRTTTTANFCSSFLEFFYDSLGFNVLNTTNLELIFYSKKDCEEGANVNKMIIPFGECQNDFLVHEMYSDYNIHSKFVLIPEEEAPFPRGVLPEIESQREWLEIELYEDDECNKTSEMVEWDHFFYHMNTVPNFLYTLPLMDGSAYKRIILSHVNTSQKILKRCNESYHYQFIIDETNDLNPYYWKELCIISLEQNRCFPDYHKGWKDNQMGSFQYRCVTNSSVPKIPTEYRSKHGYFRHWTPSCYGDAFQYREYDNGVCKNHDIWWTGGSRLDFFTDSQRMKIYYSDGTNDIKESPRCVWNETMIIYYSNLNDPGHCRKQPLEDEGECSEAICRYRVIGYDGQANDYDQYFVFLHHEKSCEYYSSHPQEFNQFKRHEKSDAAWISRYHESLCVSHTTSSLFEELDSSSLLGKCENGKFKYRIFNNSVLCPSVSNLDPNVDFQDIDGDYCATSKYSTSNYYSLTCIPYFCNDLPQYDSNVCNSHGICIGEDECVCENGYNHDKFCAKNVEGRSTPSSNTFLIALFSTILPLTVLVPCSFLIFVVCCCFVFCVCCSVLVCALLCSISGVCYISFHQKKKLLKYDKLQNFDVILKEQLLEQDSSVAHLKVNRSLFEIKFEEINISEIIGRGGSNSTVYKAEWSGRVCAFKMFRTRTLCENQNDFDEFEREVQLMASLGHPNIVRFYGATLKPPRVGIIMEYCENGELVTFVELYRERNQKHYPFSEKIRICTEIISSMGYLHIRNVIHRDLKLQNVLVDGTESSKLMDFGLSRLVERNERQKTRGVGTDHYIAPELMSREGYDEKVDVFSFAILLYAFITEKRNPYSNNDGEEDGRDSVCIKVSLNPNFRPDLRDLEQSLNEQRKKEQKYSYKWMKNLLELCWDHQPSNRFSFQELSQIFKTEKERKVEKSEILPERIEILDVNESNVTLKNEVTVRARKKSDGKADGKIKDLIAEIERICEENDISKDDYLKKTV